MSVARLFAMLGHPSVAIHWHPAVWTGKKRAGSFRVATDLDPLRSRSARRKRTSA